MNRKKIKSIKSLSRFYRPDLLVPVVGLEPTRPEDTAF